MLMMLMLIMVYVDIYLLQYLGDICTDSLGTWRWFMLMMLMLMMAYVDVDDGLC